MSEPCYFLKFGLIVTGKAEQQHLPKLFRSLVKSQICAFEVIGFVDQRSPITSERKKLKMVGVGGIIPNKDKMLIGFPARRYLENDCTLVIVIDDLEFAQTSQVQQKFNRYRNAVDSVLRDAQKPRASVHFLVNMLEAYFFAHAEALNLVFELDPAQEDFEGDVGTIRNPKAKLKEIEPNYREVDDSGKVLELLDLEYILSKPNACASLRTLFAWCTLALAKYQDKAYYQSLPMYDKFQLSQGIMSDVTKPQLGLLQSNMSN
ncbi:MAG: DUF4276 family protein [Anaerolineae bacterium]|nr:DUF4276 family protein [Anaerolineae bacterium]